MPSLWDGCVSNFSFSCDLEYFVVSIPFLRSIQTGKDLLPVIQGRQPRHGLLPRFFSTPKSISPLPAHLAQLLQKPFLLVR